MRQQAAASRSACQAQAKLKHIPASTTQTSAKMRTTMTDRSGRGSLDMGRLCGKPGPGALHGARQGINDYTGWFASDPQMSGNYFGYDGPCPPWNDERIHHYVFTLYALDVPTLGVDGTFTGAAALAALQGHVLAQAAVTGIYTQNPAAQRLVYG